MLNVQHNLIQILIERILNDILKFMRAQQLWENSQLHVSQHIHNKPAFPVDEALRGEQTGWCSVLLNYTGLS